MSLFLILAAPGLLSGQGLFLRGDSNGDQTIDISDGVHALSFLFLGGGAPPCMDASDANDDGVLDIADPVFILNFLYTGGAAPPAPGPLVPGEDPTGDDLGCGPAAEPDLFEPPSLPSSGEGPGLYLFSGESSLSAVDLRVRGRGLDFVWARKYRSRLGPDTAQGKGWDFSYNIRLEKKGKDLELHDGQSRRDLFKRQPDGSFTADGLFLLGREDAAGGFTFTSSFGGVDRFRPSPADPQGFLIASIEDRNQNRLAFDYDKLGRLVTIHDTLDTASHNRDYRVAYDANGRLESVTDFAGRQVRYGYYGVGEAGGSAGDLKSVTSPPITGTPNGNDFPEGKTVRYTYSSGFADDRLNHNLLTVTDPKGQLVLTQIYSQAADPRDPTFDHLAVRVWGDPHVYQADKLTYILESGARTEPGVVKTILNDRMGNVKEYSFDAGNRLVRMRELTGRADPSKPTTETENRPTGKLRAADPDFFETRYEWNEDSLLTRRTDPAGSVEAAVYEREMTPGGPVLSRGNLREIHRLAGPRGGDQTEIVERFEYDPTFNQVALRIDPRGGETLHTYDGSGNLLATVHPVPSVLEEFVHSSSGQLISHRHPDNGSGHRRLDLFTYYGEADGPQNGYLKEAVIDSGGLDLATRYEYDERGNLTRRSDLQGRDVLLIYDQNDQPVRVLSPLWSSSSPARCQEDLFYDLNDNLARVDTLNLDADGNTLSNTQLSTIYEYDGLNHFTRVCKEAGDAALGPLDLTCSAMPSGTFVATEHGYDANRDLNLVRFGEAASGRDPLNQVHMGRDERGLVHRFVWDSAADLGRPGLVAELRYDEEGSTAALLEGPPDGQHQSMVERDGYGRVVRATDPMGNVDLLHYDASGNIVSVRREGEPADGEGGAGNLRLEEVSSTYDAMNRLVKSEAAFFRRNSTGGEEPLGKGVAITTLEWSDSSEPVRVVDDNGSETRRLYDGAGRRAAVIDAAGNRTDFEYDGASNLVRRVDHERVEKAGAVVFEDFETRYEYDGLDRLVRTTDNLGKSQEYGYDSRSNLTRATDAAGNVTRYEYDGLSRLLSSTTVLTDDGTGAGKVQGSMVTRYQWDDASRLTTRTDPNGNTTRYGYDSQNRLVSVTLADSTVSVRSFDEYGDPVQTADPNRTVVLRGFDRVHRLTHAALQTGKGVQPDTFQSFGYDGLSRLVRAEDDDSVLTFEYDSLSRPVAETLNGKTTSSSYDAVGNLLSVTYPGGRTLSYLHDSLNRRTSISDADGFSAGYQYQGLRQGLKQILQTQVLITSSYGYDGLRRPIRTTSALAGTTPRILDDRAYLWDARSLKVSEADLLKVGPSLTYGYDSALRLVSSLAALPGTPDSPVDYQLDGAGNRIRVRGSSVEGDYTRDAALPEPADLQVDQYTRTPFDARTYDANGNLIRVEEPGGRVRVATPDWTDRLALHQDLSSGATARYRYDALGRRIGASLALPGAPPTQIRYFYQGEEVVEEEDGAGATLATYVHGSRAGEVLEMDRLLEGNDRPQHFYYLSDERDNVVGLLDAAGKPVERYEYGDFGSPRIFDPSGTRLPLSKIGNPYLLSGKRFDRETGYYFDGDYLDPRAAEYLSRGGSGDTSARQRPRVALAGVDKAAAADVLFNPKEYTITKATPWKHHDIQGLDAPTLAFTSGKPASISFELFFDRYEEGKSIRRAVGDPRPGAGGGAGISDNGWGSCFNCHPFGVESSAARWSFASGPRQSTSREMTTGHDVEYRLYGPGHAHWGSGSRIGGQGFGSCVNCHPDGVQASMMAGGFPGGSSRLLETIKEQDSSFRNILR